MGLSFEDGLFVSFDELAGSEGSIDGGLAVSLVGPARDLDLGVVGRLDFTDADGSMRGLGADVLLDVDRSSLTLDGSPMAPPRSRT